MAAAAGAGPGAPADGAAGDPAGPRALNRFAFLSTRTIFFGAVSRVVGSTIGASTPRSRSVWEAVACRPVCSISRAHSGGIDAAVIHPPPWDQGATELALAAVQDYPVRFAIMGELPLDQPDSRERVASWRKQPGMLGLRYLFLKEPMRSRLEDGTLDWLWCAAERAGIPIALLATDSLPAIGRIAERHPGLRLTIDHMGGRGGNTTLKDADAMTTNWDKFIEATEKMAFDAKKFFWWRAFKEVGTGVAGLVEDSGHSSPTCDRPWMRAMLT